MILHGYMYILRYLGYVSGNIPWVCECECVYGLYRRFVWYMVNLFCDLTKFVNKALYTKKQTNKKPYTLKDQKA